MADGDEGKRRQLQRARKEPTKPRAPYLYPDGRPMGGSDEEASKVSAFNALT
jgi:hypothetical protein